MNQVQESVNPIDRINMMVAELGPLFSLGGVVYFKGSEEFGNLTERWQLYSPPSFIAAVEVKTEQDVQYTVSLHHVGLSEE
jgi:hypothetical protein